MKILIDYSGEHSEIPEKELQSVLAGESIRARVEERISARTILLDANTEEKRFLERLAFTKDASIIYAIGRNMEDIADSIYQQIKRKDSFRVVSESRMLAERLGDILYNKGLTVKLRDPKVKVTVRTIGDKYYAGIYVTRDRGYHNRRPQYRPYFHPTSMHPKLARALVNLGKVKAGDRVLDPFCGTGGILIEAGLMGMTPVGFDIDDKMVEGCKRNLRHYGITGSIEKGDATELKNVDADAIVTDPPYGRASFTSKKTSQLYDGIGQMAYRILPDGGRLVVTLPSKQKMDYPGFDLMDYFDVKVHKSLTRRIHVLRKN
ncbi:DNA methyltransferase [Candidatus Altiarchaeota archaeon]